MKYTLVIFLLLTFSHCYKAQVDSADYYSLVRCNEFTSLGYKKIKADSIYIPLYKYDLSPTAIKILSHDYGLIDKSPVSGDVTVKETICFDDLMDLFIECKYGSGFMDSIISYSEFLAANRLGYFASKLNSGKTIEEHFKEHFKLKDTLVENQNSMFILSFDIDPSGNIINPLFYDGVLSSGEIKVLPEGIYKNELSRVLNMTNPWIPAKLRNKAIIDHQVILIAHFTFGL